MTKRPFRLYVRVRMTDGSFVTRSLPTKNKRLVSVRNLWSVFRIGCGVFENVHPAEQLTAWIGVNTDD